MSKKSLWHRDSAIQYDRFTVPDSAERSLDLLDPDGDRDGFPWVVISRLAHDKMWALVQASDIEVGWLCLCDWAKTDIIIKDIVVPLQTCSSISTTISPEGENEIIQEYLRKGDKNLIRSLHGWGHSHVTMTTGPSSIDEAETTRRLARTNQYYVRLICNKYGDLDCTLYLLDYRLAIRNVYVHVPEGDVLDPGAWAEWARRELASKVTEAKFKKTYRLSEFREDRNAR